MSAIESLIYKFNDMCGESPTEMGTAAAAELAELRETQAHDKVMLAQDGVLILDCFNILGLDSSGANTQDILTAIKSMKARLEKLEREQSEEVDEFNAGYEAFKAGKELNSAESEYGHSVAKSYDVFKVGFLYASALEAELKGDK